MTEDVKIMKKEETPSSEKNKNKKNMVVKKRYHQSSSESSSSEEDEETEKQLPVDQEQLLMDMREEHNLKFKTGVLLNVRADEGIKVTGTT